MEGSIVEEILVIPVPKTGWVGSGGGVRLMAACRRGKRLVVSMARSEHTVRAWSGPFASARGTGSPAHGLAASLALP